MLWAQTLCQKNCKEPRNTLLFLQVSPAPRTVPDMSKVPDKCLLSNETESVGIG